MIVERTEPPLTGSERELLATPTSCASTWTAPQASSPAHPSGPGPANPLDPPASPLPLPNTHQDSKHKPSASPRQTPPVT